jgi:TRAP-type C4-dicarboxylate transport system substrate-binding protein
MRLGYFSRVVACCIASAILASANYAHAETPISLKIVGGLGSLRQFTGIERPFWQQEIGELSRGRITATIHPIDRSGIRSQDMLQLMKLGVVPFGTAPLAGAVGDTPFLAGIDLPGRSPDFASQRRTIEAYRPRLKAVLRDTYDIELLGIYSYPAQVLFCAVPFSGLHDIGRLRVRTSSVMQSELMTGLGAIPVMTPFDQMVDAVQRKTVDCAITGILSGHEVGLAQITSHVHAQAISWGVSIFGANRATWDNLPADVRDTLRDSVAKLEERILSAADEDTARGLDCSRGLPTCHVKLSRKHVIVAESNAATERLQIVTQDILPNWLDRCGAACLSTTKASAIAEFGSDRQAVEWTGHERKGDGN